MLEPGRHRPEARGLKQSHHLVGYDRGGDIDVADGLTKKRVSHRAADKARIAPFRLQCAHHRARPRIGHPWLLFGIELQAHLAGSTWPGTTRPFSTCGGT